MNSTLTVWPIVSSFLLETFILFLVAAGFFLVHRTAKFLNIAHGDYVTLGAYLVYTFTSTLGWNIWITIAISVVAVGFTAILIDQVSYRYLRGASLALLLCSIGMALIVRYGIFMTWGGRFKKITTTFSNVEIYGTVISGSLLLAVAFGCFIILLAYYVLTHTRLGVSVRAMADNPQLAESFGIDTERTLKFVWFISGGSAALGGVVLALYRPLTFDMGFSWILLIIAVSILAGEKTSLPFLLGACAIITGGMELGVSFISEAYRMGIGFGMLVIAIVVKGGLRR